MEDEPYESVLLVIKECYVYRIPPRSTSRGYRASDWDVNQFMWQGRLRVIAKGDALFINLEDSTTGELFAQCPYKLDGSSVEPVLDSSRYFVLTIVDQASGKHAFIGLGFPDRSMSFDFNVALQDHLKIVQGRKDGGGNKKAPAGPKIDFSLKSDQKITINIGGLGAKKKSDRPSGSDEIPVLLPPPPSNRQMHVTPTSSQENLSSTTSSASASDPFFELSKTSDASQAASHSVASTNINSTLAKDDDDWASFGDFVGRTASLRLAMSTETDVAQTNNAEKIHALQDTIEPAGDVAQAAEGCLKSDDVLMNESTSSSCDKNDEAEVKSEPVVEKEASPCQDKRTPDMIERDKLITMRILKRKPIAQLSERLKRRLKFATLKVLLGVERMELVQLKQLFASKPTSTILKTHEPSSRKVKQQVNIMKEAAAQAAETDNISKFVHFELEDGQPKKSPTVAPLTGASLSHILGIPRTNQGAASAHQLLTDQQPKPYWQSMSQSHITSYAPSTMHNMTTRSISAAAANGCSKSYDSGSFLATWNHTAQDSPCFTVNPRDLTPGPSPIRGSTTRSRHRAAMVEERHKHHDLKSRMMPTLDSVAARTSQKNSPVRNGVNNPVDTPHQFDPAMIASATASSLGKKPFSPTRNISSSSNLAMGPPGLGGIPPLSSWFTSPDPNTIHHHDMGFNGYHPFAHSSGYPSHHSVATATTTGIPHMSFMEQLNRGMASSSAIHMGNPRSSNTYPAATSTQHDFGHHHHHHHHHGAAAAGFDPNSATQMSDFQSLFPLHFRHSAAGCSEYDAMAAAAAAATGGYGVPFDASHFAGDGGMSGGYYATSPAGFAMAAASAEMFSGPVNTGYPHQQQQLPLSSYSQYPSLQPPSNSVLPLSFFSSH